MSRSVCRLIPLLFLSLFVFSCANAAKHLRAQPAWFMEPKSSEPLLVTLPPLDKDGVPTDAPADKIELKCVRTPRSEGVGTSEAEAVPQCLYMSIDVREILKTAVRNRAERNRLVHLLMNVSDYNCSTFLMRAFAQKAGTETARNSIKDIATGIAAGTARVAGAFSSGIGLANLVGGSVIDNVNATYYADKTFQVMAASIGAERDKARTVILKRSSSDLGDYSFFEALEDAHVFDDSCSLRRGLESLAAAANTQKQDSEKELTRQRNAMVTASAHAPNAVATADVSPNQQ